jgi:hypothetical protein
MDSDNANGGSPHHSSKTTLQTLQSSSDGPRLDSNHLDDVREPIFGNAAAPIRSCTESILAKNKNRKRPETESSPKLYAPLIKKFKLLSTPETRRSQKRNAIVQAWVEKAWAQEEEQYLAQNQVQLSTAADSCENPKYRLFIQAEEQKKKKRICAALYSCLPPTTTDEQMMQLYSISVSCFQSFKGLDGTAFEKTVQVPPSFDRIIGLQNQVTVNNGVVDTVNNDGREDFVPYLIANGPFKHGDRVPVIISHKVSLRERWKQDEGVAQHSRVFLITLAGLQASDVSVQKLKKARAHNIHIVVPNLSEFRDKHFVTNKRPLCLTESQMWKQIHSCLSSKIEK